MNGAWLISDQTEDLTRLPKEVLNKPAEIQTIYVIESEDAACMKVMATFYDSAADKLRGMLKAKGLKEYSKECLEDIQEFYGHGAR